MRTKILAENSRLLNLDVALFSIARSDVWASAPAEVQVSWAKMGVMSAPIKASAAEFDLCYRVDIRPEKLPKRVVDKLSNVKKAATNSARSITVALLENSKDVQGFESCVMYMLGVVLVMIGRSATSVAALQEELDPHIVSAKHNCKVTDFCAEDKYKIYNFVEIADILADLS